MELRKVEIGLEVVDGKEAAWAKNDVVMLSRTEDPSPASVGEASTSWGIR
jgi:hypothetical protein